MDGAVDNDKAHASSDNTFNSGTNAWGDGTCSDGGYNNTLPANQSITDSVESDLALDALFSDHLTEGEALPNRPTEAEQTTSSSWVATPVAQTDDRVTRSGRTVKTKRHDEFLYYKQCSSCRLLIPTTLIHYYEVS